MNIGAFASVSSRSLQERTTTGEATAEPARDSSDPLAVLENFVESANLSRKAFAEDRLKHLKEQMNTLMLFNLAPGFLVDHSARMARELESAAGDFAKAFKALGTDAQSSPQVPSPDAYGDAADGAPPEPGPGETANVPPAYLEILGGLIAQQDQPVQQPVASQQDAETMASFISVARQLSSVVDLATEAAEQNRTVEQSAADTRASASRVVDSMARLRGPWTTGVNYW